MDESRLFGRDWFYPFRLPDGRVTPTYNDGKLDTIHSTRMEMIDAVLERSKIAVEEARVLDIACHQGWFASQMAQRGASEVLAVDARAEHVADAELIAQALELPNMRAEQSDVHRLDAGELGQFDVVLMLGLIYHLEDPIGAMRRAFELTRGVCLIETQVVPHMSGPVDWGHPDFVRPLKGVFGIIDEMDETHAPEASTLGICLAPSTPGLLWVLDKIGFARVELLEPPADAYGQLKHGKRVMVAAYRED